MELDAHSKCSRSVSYKVGWDRLRFLHLLGQEGIVWGSEEPQRSWICVSRVEGIGGWGRGLAVWWGVRTLDLGEPHGLPVVL